MPQPADMDGIRDWRALRAVADLTVGMQFEHRNGLPFVSDYDLPQVFEEAEVAGDCLWPGAFCTSGSLPSGERPSCFARMVG